ncbi:MarR family transcriptional regulator [uncultured Psychroserpens sp.]|uniref:MarR family winged helix-turn-helix transcriptional regulator n=1 Tax=uncultured Psychroserpens sp. TaxID=255436 RepID=UPI00260E7F06|nr:MarR family transcriptional regulator [uncultured Psychroserpens sp.]
MFLLPNESVFYSIEKAIKTYRRLAQNELAKAFNDITIDQALILIFIANNPKLNQAEISELIFKDRGSVTRMIELLVKNNYLSREIHHLDRRKFKLDVTKKGEIALHKITAIVAENRSVALENITKKQTGSLQQTLNQIITNCSK